MIRVTVWNEYKHEREFEAIGRVYPAGIHGCIAAFLREEPNLTVRTATFDEPEHGLTEEILKETDVLIIWSHALQEEFSDEVAERVQRHVLSGMGLIAVHSAHFSKIMKKLMGTTMTLKWQHGQQENLWCIAPNHPIAAGVPEKIFLEEEEMYGEYFDIPKPDEVIFAGWFSGGQVFRSGCTFTRGRGKIFYFQPGHEEYPIYHRPEIQRIIKNAVGFCAPTGGRKNLECEEVKE